MFIPRANVDVPSFAMEIRGSDLAGAGLCDGDIVSIDPAKSPLPGDLVLARIRSRHQWHLRMCRLLVQPFGEVYLVAEPASGRVPVTCTAFEVLGPVTSAVSHLRPAAARRRRRASSGSYEDDRAGADLQRRRARRLGEAAAGGRGENTRLPTMLFDAD